MYKNSTQVTNFYSRQLREWAVVYIFTFWKEISFTESEDFIDTVIKNPSANPFRVFVSLIWPIKTTLLDNGFQSLQSDVLTSYHEVAL